MQEVFEKIIEKIEEIYENHGSSAETYRAALIKTVNQIAKEYSHGHFGCNSNGEHEKCDGCGMAPTCKEKYKHWFGVQDEKDGWIPCSERLPEKEGKYLVTLEKWNVISFADFKDIKHNPHFNAGVIAWQSLPTPYQKGE